MAWPGIRRAGTLACQHNDTILAPDGTAGFQTKTRRGGGNLMQSITRRKVVLSAAAAGTAFGLSKRVEIISPASAQQGGGPSALNPKGMQFHRFKVGDIEVTQV